MMFKTTALLCLIASGSAFCPLQNPQTSSTALAAYGPSNASWKKSSGGNSSSNTSSAPSYGGLHQTAPNTGGGGSSSSSGGWAPGGGQKKKSYAISNASWKTGKSASPPSGSSSYNYSSPPAPKSAPAPAPAPAPSKGQSGGSWESLAKEWAAINKDKNDTSGQSKAPVKKPSSPASYAKPPASSPAPSKGQSGGSWETLAEEWAAVNKDKDSPQMPPKINGRAPSPAAKAPAPAPSKSQSGGNWDKLAREWAMMNRDENAFA